MYNDGKSFIDGHTVLSGKWPELTRWEALHSVIICGNLTIHETSTYI